MSESVVTASAELVDEVAVDEQQDAAARRVAELLSPAAIDSLVADATESGMGLDGAQGLLNQLTKAVLERALQSEMVDHLGYDRGDPTGHGSGNSRNGTSGKSVITNSGPVRLTVPRDRNGTFEPKFVPKGQRRLGSVDDMILSLYARGMTTRDIKEHLSEVYGADVSPALISQVTDVVSDEIVQWQTRPLDAVYPILYIDAVMVKIREGGTVDNRAAYLAVGVDTDGFKHVLGIWVADTEGAKFWQNVLAELVNRGVRDVLIVCCDGLKGLPESIGNVWPQAIVQTCVVHYSITARSGTSRSSRTVAAVCRASCSRASRTPASASRAFHSAMSRRGSIGLPLGWGSSSSPPVASSVRIRRFFLESTSILLGRSLQCENVHYGVLC